MIRTCAYQIRTWCQEHPARAGTLTGWGGQGLSLLFQVILVPLMFAKLGTHVMGQWCFMAAWFGGLAHISDFSFSQNFSRQASFSLHKPISNTSKRILQSDYILAFGLGAIHRIYHAYCALAFLGLIFPLLLAVIIERYLTSYSNTEYPLISSIEWYLMLTALVGQAAWRTQSALLTGLLLPQVERIAFSIGLTIQSLLMLAVLIFTPSFLMVTASYALGWWMIFGITAYAAHGKLRPHPARISLPLIKALWKLSWRQGAASITIFFIYSIQPIFIGLWLGVADVARYSVSLRLADIITSGLRQMLQPQINFMARYVGKGDSKGLLRSLRLTAFTILGGGGMCYLAFVLLGPTVLQWWTAGDVVVPISFLLLVALLQFVVISENVMAVFVVAHGRFPFLTIAWIGAFLSVGASYLLLPPFGIYGAVGSSLIGCLGATFWFTVREFARTIRLSLSR